MWTAIPVSKTAPPQTSDAACELACRCVARTSAVDSTSEQREALKSLLVDVISSAMLTEALRCAISSSSKGTSSMDRSADRDRKEWRHEFARVGELVDDRGWRRITGHMAVSLNSEERVVVCRNIVQCSRSDFEKTDALRLLSGRPIGEALLFGTFVDPLTGSERPKSTRIGEIGDSDNAAYYSLDEATVQQLVCLLPTDFGTSADACLARRVRYIVHCANDAAVDVVELFDLPALAAVLGSNLRDTAAAAPQPC